MIAMSLACDWRKRSIKKAQAGQNEPSANSITRQVRLLETGSTIGLLGYFALTGFSLLKN
jgi:hypothetical protein